jgi:hypothetical protein
MAIVDLIQIPLGMLIGWRSLCALNQMGPETDHMVRLLHLALATLGAALAIAPFYPGQGSETFKLAALAVYLALHLFDRRRPS